MPRWFRANALMESTKDIENRETLNIPDLPIDKIWDSIVIDLDKIVSYCPDYDKEGSRVDGQCEVTMVHGGYITLDVSFDTLDKRVRS